MKNYNRSVLALMFCAALAAAPLARADEALPVGEPVVEDGGEIERWWGVVGTIVCGVGIRMMRIPGIGLNPWVLAPTIGGCLLGLLDALTSVETPS